MKRRIRIFLTIIIWFLIVAACAVLYHVQWTKEEADAVFLDGCASGDSVYLAENMRDESVLYVTDKEGKVKDLSLIGKTWPKSTVAKLDYEDGLYGVIAQPDGIKEGQAAYRIVSFDAAGRPSGQTAPFRFMQEGTLTGFQAKAEGFYLTQVLENGTDAGVYFVETAQLTALSAGDGDQENTVGELLCRELVSADTGRRIAEADYENGVFLLHTDDKAGAEAFEEPQEVLQAFEQRGLSVVQQLLLCREEMIFFLLLLAVGYIILIIFSALLRDRTHLVYTIALTELVLLVITATGFLQVTRAWNADKETRNSQYGKARLETLAEEIDSSFQKAAEKENFYQNKTYQKLQERFDVYTDGSEGTFADLCLVTADEHQVIVSASGRNGRTFENLYGDNTKDLLERLASGRAGEDQKIRMDGSSFRVMGLSAGAGSEYLLMGVLPADDSLEIPRFYLIFALAVFLAGSAVCLLLLAGQSREWRRFVEAIQQLAGGGRAGDAPVKAHSRDIRIAWNSLQELEKAISRANYSSYRAFKSSYRFLPKNLEKIFSRDSITEVKGGDAVRISGTVALLSSTEPDAQARQSAQIMNRFVMLVEKYQKESGGFFVSGQCDLDRMKLLFLEETQDTVSFAISFLQEFSGDAAMQGLETGVLLHYSRFTFGVAGTNTQSFPFLLSQELREIESYAGWFKSLGLKLVITEAVKERENLSSLLRYIGYIRLSGSGGKVNMYEALDACPIQEMQLKAESDGQFQSALRLFYQRDFYLARRAFSDVLKGNPTDYVAKWYLFTCEKYLNKTHLEGDVCRLAMEENPVIR